MIAAGTSDPAVFCNLGILCKNSGRIDEALEHYEQALEFNPYEWGINPDAGIRFISVRGKKQRRRAAKQDVYFIYEEKKGGLFFNENGSKKALVTEASLQF